MNRRRAIVFAWSRGRESCGRDRAGAGRRPVPEPEHLSSSFPMRPAAGSTSSRASSGRSCPTGSAGRWWSRTGPAPTAISPPRQVTKSAPDGHTLLLGSIGMLTVNPAVVANLTYDSQRDFAPISMIAKFPLILTVNAKAPVRTVQELVAYAKANPEKANAAASGRSSRWCRRCSSSAPAPNSPTSPIRANSEAMMALMRGDALMSLSDVGPATGPLQDGRVRALAVTSPQAAALAPRRADHGGSGLQGHGGRVLDRAAGARQDAARDHQEARRTRSSRS